MRKIVSILGVAVLSFAVIFTLGMTTRKSNVESVAVVSENKDISISADYAYLIDYDSGKVLYQNNAEVKRPIASMVKIMTLLLTFESVDRGEIKLSDMVTISNNAAKQTGSEMFLDEGVEYSVSDIIKGVVTMSANDGSVALAEYVGGSEEQFISAMNNRAKELGMKNTLYANPTGLPSDSEQYSTAKDVTILMRELVAHKKYHEYSTIWLEDYKHPSGRITQLANTNKLIRHYKGCDSGKTGYTDSAKYCLSASAKRNDMRVVGTVMGANDSKARFKAMSDMFNYAFNNYKKQVYIKGGTPLSIEVSVKNGKVNKIVPYTTKDLAVLVSKKEGKYEIKYDIPNSVKAPLKKGDVIGSVMMVDGDNVLSKVDVLAPCDVEKASLWDIIKNIFR